MEITTQENLSTSSMVTEEVRTQLKDYTLSKVFSCRVIGDSFTWNDRIKGELLEDILPSNSMESLKKILLKILSLTNFEVKENMSLSIAPTFEEFMIWTS